MANKFPPPHPADTEDTELIDLAAIWGSLKRHWRILLACIIVALACATTLCFILPTQWQASATLQIGQLPVMPTTLIESPAQTAERFKQHQLQDQALTAAGLPLNDEKDGRTRLFRKTLKATAGKNTNFVDVSVAGFSQEDAKTYLSKALQALIDMHELRLAPMMKNLDDRFETNAGNMAQAIAAKARLQDSLKPVVASPAGAKFEPSIIAMNLLAGQEDIIRSLRAERATLIDLHTKTNAFPTTVVDAVFVPANPYSPKLLTLLVSGLIIGAIVGVALALFLDRNRPKTPY